MIPAYEGYDPQEKIRIVAELTERRARPCEPVEPDLTGEWRDIPSPAKRMQEGRR